MKNNNSLLQALDLNSNKFVEASAGAGKTFALTKRYCRILDSFAEEYLSGRSSEKLGVGNILVITFTRKAAAEMSQRIYRDLKTLLDGNELEEMKTQGIDLGRNIRNAPDDYKLWLKSNFSGNAISTIDSFCASILRENAHLLGLDPKFSAEDEAMAYGFLEENLNEFLERKSRNFDNNLALILDNCSIPQTKDFLKYLQENKQFLKTFILSTADKTPSQIKDQWRAKYSLKFDSDKLLTAFRSILRCRNSVLQNSTDAGLIFLDNLKSALQTITDLPAENRNMTILETVIPLFRTQAGTYRKKAPGADKNWSDKTVRQDFKTAFEEIIALLSDELPPEKLDSSLNSMDLQAAEVLCALCKLFLQFDDDLTRAKQRLNMLSFDDILLKTYELLSSDEPTRLKLHRRFRHIMVDEFQDTNDLRWKIIQAIASDENHNLRKTGLFIVGDKKQSIYSFQQADVEVMNRVRAALTSLQPVENVVVPLNENFRSSEQYLHQTVNPLFTKIFPNAETPLSPYEVRFEPANYPVRTGKSEETRRKIAGMTPVACLLQASYTPSDENASSDIYIPALHTAMVVKEFLQWVDKAGIDEIPAIAVLMRRMIKIQHYQRAFQKYGVDFQIIGGRGLYRQQEAFDLLRLLSVLDNPLDDMALTGLLRSPFFCLTDNEIHSLFKLKEPGLPLYEIIRITPGAQPVYRQLHAWLEDAKTLPPDRLLTKILSSDEKELGYVSEIAGAQRLANLDKMTGFIHKLALKGKSLREIRAMLEYLSDKVENMEQARLPVSAKVQVMSIHQAKGLQFPAVIIPEMNVPPKNDALPIAHAEMPSGDMEIGLSLQDEEGENIGSGLRKTIMNLARRKSEAEDIRLFYVAVTRAKYRAAILADFKEKSRRTNTWWKRFIVDSGFAPENLNAEIPNSGSRYEGIRFSVITSNDIQKSLAGAVETSDFPIPYNPAPEYEPAGFYWEASVHDLMDKIFPAPDSITVSGDTDALAYGSLFHKAMEEGWTDYDKHISDYDSYIQSNFEDAAPAPLLEKLKKQLADFRQSALYGKLIPADYFDKYSELPLTGWIKGEKSLLQVSGRVDLLFKSAEKWYCLDYKTDACKDRIFPYIFQMQTYLWMLKQNYGMEAAGYLYFSHFGETIEVTLDDAYWEKAASLFPGEKHSLEIPPDNCAPEIVKAVDALISDAGETPVVVVDWTKKAAVDLHKALLKKTTITPNIRIIPWGEILRSAPIPGRRLSPYAARLITEKLLRESGSENITKGQCEILSSALLESELHGNSVAAEYADIQKNFTEFKKAGNLFSDKDIYDYILNSNYFRGEKIILNGFHGSAKIEVDLINHIQNNASEFYFIDNLAGFEIKTKFPYTEKILEEKALEPLQPRHAYRISFSVDDEIDKTAKSILSIPGWENRLDDIKIAAASMELYIPSIKRIFASYDIPVTIFKNEPVMERPVAQLALKALDFIIEGGNPLWETAAGIVLHPLMEPGDEMLKTDVFCRKYGVTYLKKLVEIVETTENPLPYLSSAVTKIGRISEILTLDQEKHIFAAAEKLRRFIYSVNLQSKLSGDIVSLSALSKIMGLLDQIPKTYSLAGLTGTIDDFRYDMTEQLRGVEVPTRRQQKGVEILGTKDSAHLSPLYLFILGMTEKQFPATPVKNPFLSGDVYNPWFADLCLMKRWTELPGNIIFSAPESGDDGNASQPSTFLEYLRPCAETLPPARMSRRAHFLQYANVSIAQPGNNPYLQRHNDYLSPSTDSPFRGKALPAAGSGEIVLSSSSLDELLKCPQRYWFGKILQIEPLKYDADSKARLTMGNVIHKTLCEFGKKGGFALTADFAESAYSSMAECLDNALAEEKLSLKDSLILQKRYRFYFDGLSEGKQNNLLVRLLKWNNDLFASLPSGFFEQEFGKPQSEKSWAPAVLETPGLKLLLQGRIDKILMDHENKIIAASDYKTGDISLKDTAAFWSSQFPVYYFALKQKFPDYKVILLYEQLKTPAKSGPSETFGDDIRPLPDNIAALKELSAYLFAESESDSIIVSPSETAAVYLSLAEKIAAGIFPLAERELNGKACKNCKYEGLCRKDCVVRE